ncbi:MAG: response regulator transcription factor [Acidobacteriia bacterium]|nr:response regulator transcription factor [Terriglobia bacterium]
MSMPLEILLADDHEVVRQGLRALLERAGFQVVGEAGDGQDAIRLAEKFHPDVAVLDVAMPLLNGIDAARGITKVSPRTKTILLTMYIQGRNVLEGLRTGVRGVVVKSKAFDELLRAIQAVCKGDTYLSPDVSNVVVEAYLTNCPEQVMPLRDRERQVLQLVAEGKTSKEIATILGISIKTAESHRSKIMERLDIHDTAGLVRYAIRHGLIQP